MQLDWKQFKDEVHDVVPVSGRFIFRGQADSKWRLMSTLHRLGAVRSHEDFVAYFNVRLPQVKELVEAWGPNRWNLQDPNELAEFLAFLQHNGFPTPLLDWTESPYIAAFFAFSAVNHFDPQSESVAIYAFNQALWRERYNQVYLYDAPEANVSILKPSFRANHKQLLQQGLFTFTNQNDVETHITANEKRAGEFLIKFEIPTSERGVVMKDLSLMGVTAMQLAPGIESVCKRAYEDLSILFPVGYKRVS